ncbi:hypothetical protein K443DRAFT_674778 [Laccaria amethystina LaAM-08-1]|uniref:Uncharacterized protein n=1 Tax=Laccaria amethystina LaAM-08-1 TaxID=1095629 RepID=A0A0C9YCU2_9AGAR|nr:hypothetical protein K443DRAFT_674778 [Laccaria amethystina LaAM-08-1]
MLFNLKTHHYSTSRGILTYPICGSGRPPKVLLNPSAILGRASGERAFRSPYQSCY